MAVRFRLSTLLIATLIVGVGVGVVARAYRWHANEQISAAKLRILARMHVIDHPVPPDSGLSWRVHMLQVQGEEERKLFEKFHLDEPWDSPHNRQFITQMPEFLRAPNSRVAHEGRTRYIMIEETAEGEPWYPTYIEMEDSHAVIWTKPGDAELYYRVPERRVHNRLEIRH